LKILMRVRHDNIERIRLNVDALKFTERDKKGPLMKVMARENARQVRLAFSTQGATVATGPWPALSPGYAAWKKKWFPTKKILRLTDTLFDKATKVSHPAYIKKFVKPFRYVLGFRDEVGFKHQVGADNLPRRSLMDKKPGDIEHFKLELLNEFNKRKRAVERNA
jgi:hypothetical protein